MALVQGDGDLADNVMRNLFDNHPSEEQQAELHFYLCRRGTIDNKHKSEALRLYEKLFAKTPAFHYGDRLEELRK